MLIRDLRKKNSESSQDAGALLFFVAFAALLLACTLPGARDSALILVAAFVGGWIVLVAVLDLVGWILTREAK